MRCLSSIGFGEVRQMMDPMDQIVRLLPCVYQDALRRLSPQEYSALTEIRLRQGRQASFVIGQKEHPLPVDNHPAVTEQTIRHIINAATDFSPYAVSDEIADGFLSLQGGHRIGLCGTAVMEQGKIVTFKQISSLCIRIARAVSGVADELAAHLNETQQSALIIGPPASGKTTTLRDAIRLLSDRYDQRVSVVDERGEIASMRFGAAQLPVGRLTDVLCGCGKDQGIVLCLRAMNPQWIAVDEITREADVQAMRTACYCGVKLLATAHAESVTDFCARPVYQSLLSLGFFRSCYVLSMDRSGHFQTLPC